MPSVSPLADLLNSWAAQADDSRRTSALANTIQQYGGLGGQGQQAPQPVPQQQGGILSNLLGLTSSPQPQPAAAGQPGQDQGGFFSKLFGLGGPQPQPAGAPLDLQPSTAPAPQPAPSPGAVTSGPSGTRPASAGAGFTSGPPMSYAPAAAAAPAAPSFAPAPSGPLPTFAAAGGAPGQDNTSRALAFYQSKGLSPLAASALVGGFKTESGPGLNTQAVNAGDGQDGSTSIGVPQWNGDRARGFLNYARTNGLDPSDINTQLQYSWLELNGPEKGTLQALMNPNLNPGTATAAALGYERPAGWSAANPYGAKTFGSRLKNTVQLAQGGFSAPFDGSAVGPDPTRFAPDPSQGGALPSMVASGQGLNLPQATPLSRLLAQRPSNSVGSGYAASGQEVPTDAQGNALGTNGQPTALAFGAPPVAASAPASRAIAAAAPAGDDPLVSVPGYSGQWNKARIAAAPDGTDVPDDAELARAQGGGQLQAVQVPRGNALAAPAPASVPTAPPAVHAVMPQQSQSPYQITPQMIQALLQNEDTRGFGIDLWKSLATSKKAPIVQDGYVLDGNTGQLMYALPQKQAPVTVGKNSTLVNPSTGAVVYDNSSPDTVTIDPSQYAQYGIPAGTPGPVQKDSDGKLLFPMKQGQSINIDQKAESAQEQGYGKAAGEQLGEVMKAASTAPQALNTVRMMRAAAAAGGDDLSTGPLAQVTLKAKQAIGNVLGISMDGVPEGEVINNLGYGLATQAARAISNRPTQFEFGQALLVKPGLAQSKAGFNALLNLREQDLNDQMALGKLASVRANRDNWPAVVADYYAQHPVMSPFDPTRPLGPQDVQAINGSQQQAAAQSISAQDASALPVISSPEAAARLKPGTLFKTPTGRVMQR